PNAGLYGLMLSGRPVAPTRRSSSPAATTRGATTAPGRRDTTATPKFATGRRNVTRNTCSGPASVVAMPTAPSGEPDVDTRDGLPGGVPVVEAGRDEGRVRVAAELGRGDGQPVGDPPLLRSLREDDVPGHVRRRGAARHRGRHAQRPGNGERRRRRDGDPGRL